MPLFDGNRLSTTRLTIPVPGLPEALRSLVICHISDLHVNCASPLLESVAESVHAESPHAVCITGDIVWRQSDIERNVIPLLTRLKSPLGVYTVPGNWEHRGCVPLWELRRRLSGIPVPLLMNENIIVEFQGERIAFIGLDDPSTLHHDAEMAIAGTEEASLRIALAHSPDAAEDLAGRGIHLMLAGHTHGGQLLLPPLPPFWLKIFNKSAVAGLHWVGSMPMFVTRGIGAVGPLPRRLFCPPEIAYISFKPA
ncbi:MAG TPA: metallophosphoesterase [Candidatus Brocadiia bacterium]|nr:metallophosphoesterase [Candidatus Brocadiia bacterium]